MILHETRKKDPAPNLVFVKALTIYAVLLKTVLLIPMVVAFTAFLSPDLYGLEGSAVWVGLLSVLGIALLGVNMTLFILFFRANSPFSKLPFAASVNFLEELRTGTKVLLGFYGSIATASRDPIFYQAFCGIYLVCLVVLIQQRYVREGVLQHPFDRLSELGPVLGMWALVSTILELIIQSQGGLGLFLLGVGTVMVPFAWSEILHHKLYGLLTGNYKSMRSANECLIYNYHCIRLVNTCDTTHSLNVLEGILNYHILHCKKPPELCCCQDVRLRLLSFKITQTR